MRLIDKMMLGLALASVPAFASAWEHEFERGVDLYSAVDGVSAVRLVCDPNSVYGDTTESAVLVSLGATDDASAETTFRFADGATVMAAMVQGRIGKADAPAETWDALLAGFRSNAAVEVSVGNQIQTVNLGEPMPFTCT